MAKARFTLVALYSFHFYVTHMPSYIKAVLYTIYMKFNTYTTILFRLTIILISYSFHYYLFWDLIT